MKVYLTVFFYLVCFLFLLELLYFLSCIASRLLFVVRLRHVVKKRGGRVKFLRLPLRSFFFSYDGEDIIATLPDQTMVLLKFFPFFHKRKSIVLYDEKNMSLQKQSALIAGNTSFGFLPRGTADLSDMHRIKTKKYSSVFSDLAEKRVMLFSPAPISARAITSAGNAILLDNGIATHHFECYTEKGILSHFDG